jgi:diguanylate cyclase (GGDEF)-like protein
LWNKDLRVIGFFVGTGILNLLVGYAIAVLVSDHAPNMPFRLPKFAVKLPGWFQPISWLNRGTRTLRSILSLLQGLLSKLIKRRPVVVEPAEAVAEPPTEIPSEPTPEITQEPVPIVEPPSPLQDVPKEWLNLLLAERLEPQSFVEASAHVLRLEVGKYREQLLVADGRARGAQATGNVEAIEVLRGDVVRINQAWLATQKDAAERLGGQHGKMEGYEETGRALEDTLLDQAAQIESTENNLLALDVKHDAAAAAKRICTELSRLIDLAHTLRDRMFDTLAFVLRTEQRLGGLSDAVLMDPLTGLFNRIGLEQLAVDWSAADAARLRMASICLIDIDRVARLNERLGPRAGDRMISVIGQELNSFTRKDRGFDRVIRVDGQRFVIFLGDSGPRQALTAIERIRQTIEALTLNCDGTEIEFTISTGVCEFDCLEPVSTTLSKARATLKEAQQAGRNRTAIDDGKGPEVIADPPRYAVKARVINVPAFN